MLAVIDAADPALLLLVVTVGDILVMGFGSHSSSE